MNLVEAADDIRAGLIDGTYRQGRGGTAMNIMAIAGITWLHWLMTRELLCPPWLVAMLLLSSLRGVIIFKVCADLSAYATDLKERLFVIPLLGTSLLWAVLPPLVFPGIATYEKLALAVIQAGMAGGAASVLAGLNWSARFYLACMLGPASLILSSEQPYGIALTGLGLAYLGVMLLTHAQSRRMLMEAHLRLHENRQLSSAAMTQRAQVERLNEDLLAAQSKLWEQNNALEAMVVERTEKMRLSAVAVDNTAEGVMVLDHLGIVLEVNPAFTHITGLAPGDIVGRHLSSLGSHPEEASAHDRMWKQLIQAGRWKGELWSRKADGGTFLERRLIDGVRNADDQVTHYVLVFNDITEAREKDERIRYLAYHDTLTGLPNRLLLEDRLRQGIALAERERQRLAVMFLDIDHFKGVNDGLGHAVGDVLLQQVAVLIREQIRSCDTLGRLGGDEFLILLHGIRHSESCAVLARKISHALAAPLQVRSHQIHIEVSIGIAVYPDDGTDAATLMKNADTAMYEAKTAGRGTFRYFQANMSEQAARRLELDLDLRQAIQRNELSLEYQAKVSASSGTVVGYEALLRWRNQKQGCISPAQFIPVAEDTGLITQIGEWVLVETCQQIARCELMGLGWLPVAINVSAKQLSAGDLVSRVRKTTAQAAISPALLQIEVTESVLMAHRKEVVQTLHALKALGVRVAIDDFGTGYSSLAYLRHLPIDVLKIDRSFVAESELDANGLAIVKTILALGRTLGLTVVAEGVETQSQSVLLRKLGCNQLQGFLFAIPVSGEQIAADLLAERAEAGAPTVAGIGCNPSSAHPAGGSF